MKRLVLYFHTSSDTKYAHVQYLLRLHGMQVLRAKSFRGYPELQVERARESLRAGAEYVRSQFAMPFIIEDTEVRVEAYSAGRAISYPGFDVKRWWQVTTFEDIDAKCRQAGTRRASQTSHICLSIPGLDLVFYRGTVHGEIALRPNTGPDDPATPWLNSKDFGSIFIAKGTNAQFGGLLLEESLRVDFRKRAIDQLAGKLKKLNAVLNLDPGCYRIDDERAEAAQITLFG